MVTIVLLKVALIHMRPVLTLRLAFFFFLVVAAGAAIYSPLIF
jgi:hypothetical protein